MSLTDPKTPTLLVSALGLPPASSGRARRHWGHGHPGRRGGRDPDAAGGDQLHRTVRRQHDTRDESRDSRSRQAL